MGCGVHLDVNRRGFLGERRGVADASQPREIMLGAAEQRGRATIAVHRKQGSKPQSVALFRRMSAGGKRGRATFAVQCKTPFSSTALPCRLAFYPASACQPLAGPAGTGYCCRDGQDRGRGCNLVQGFQRSHACVAPPTGHAGHGRCCQCCLST